MAGYAYATQLAALRATNTAYFCENAINGDLGLKARGELTEKIKANAVAAVNLAGSAPIWLARAFVDPECTIPKTRPALRCACLQDGVF